MSGYHARDTLVLVEVSVLYFAIYKANVTNFKNNIEESIHQAEVKTSLLGDDINNIVNVISEALKKAAYNSGMGKSCKKKIN